MRIDKTYKIEKIPSKDLARIVLSEPYLKAKEGKLIATDGRKLVIIPVTDTENDSDGYVPSIAIKEARKGEGYISANGSIKVEDTEYKRPELGTFPSIDPVIPKKDRKELTIGLNPTFLLEIANAMGNINEIHLHIELKENGEFNNTAIRLSNYTESFGLLMPIKVAEGGK